MMECSRESPNGIGSVQTARVSPEHKAAADGESSSPTPMSMLRTVNIERNLRDSWVNRVVNTIEDVMKKNAIQKLKVINRNLSWLHKMMR